MIKLDTHYPDLEAEWKACQKRLANGADFEKELPLMQAVVGEKFRRLYETEKRREMRARRGCQPLPETEEEGRNVILTLEEGF